MRKGVVLFVLAWVAVPCAGATYYVDANGTGDYATIQAAINDANHGDTIILLPGIYTGDGNRDIDYLGKAITIRSTDPNDPCTVAATIIDCNGTQADPHRGFYFHSAEDANSILAGLTITSGYAPTQWVVDANRQAGGAVLCCSASPTITHCTFRSNVAKYGLSLYLADSNSIVIHSIMEANADIGMTACEVFCRESNAELRDCTLDGGHYSLVSGVDLSSGRLTIRRCTIANMGCGIHAGYDADLVVRQSTISSNSYYGIRAGSDSNLLIADSSILDNTYEGIQVFEADTLTLSDSSISGNGRGGISFWGNSIELTGCVISQNSSDQGGGGLSMGSVQIATLTNCTISENSARMEGGGIYFDGDSIELTGCTISENDSTRDGGGIFISEAETATLSNCVITDNQAGDCGGGIATDNDVDELTVTNCQIRRNSARRGAGIYAGELVVVQSTIADNIAKSPWPTEGGGIRTLGNTIIESSCLIRNSAMRGGGLYSGTCKVTNSFFYENRAATVGAALLALGGDSIITNCTFADNGPRWVAAIQAGSGGTANHYLSNCILWDKGFEINVSGNSTVAVAHSCIRGGWEGYGNIDQDPQFALEHDYHLMPGSPCINTGTNDPCGGLPATDLDGNPRPLDGNGDASALADMGAFEFNPDIPSIAVSGTSLFYIQGPGEPDTRILNVRNCGAGTLNWHIVEDASWLDVYPVAGKSNGDINEVRLSLVDPNSLPVGYYYCTLTVSDQNAVNSPVDIDLTWYIANVLEVPGQYTTIQQAIDDACDHDIVLLADGTYTGYGNRDIDYLGKPIRVCSENGAENCIIDCNGTEADPHRGFYFHNNEGPTSILDGLTVTNGYASKGGGIYCGNASPVIRNCVVRSNNSTFFDQIAEAPPGGGGIYCTGGTPTVSGCLIAANSAISGAGIGCENSNVTIEDCLVTGNYVVPGTYYWLTGGGVHLWASGFQQRWYPSVQHTVITGNSAGAGGGLACVAPHGTQAIDATIEDCLISRNTAVYGAGLYSSSAISTITRCDIIGNTANGPTGGTGGGVVFAGSPCDNVLAQSRVIGNRAVTRSGGGIFFTWYSPKSKIVNCTIAYNTATANGGGVCSSSGSTGELENCIVYGNDANQGPQIGLEHPQGEGAASLTTQYSDISGGIGEVYVDSLCTLNWGLGNIDADPCFIEAGYWDANGTPNDANDDFWVDGDYHLKSEGWRWDTSRKVWTWDDVTSRCIDAGNPGYDLADEPATLDVDPNNEWGENLRINMGAYGGSAEASIPPYDWALLADLTNDGTVDFNDYAYQAVDYEQNEDNLPGDLNRDGMVGEQDLALLAEDWLKETIWH